MKLIDDVKERLENPKIRMALVMGTVVVIGFGYMKLTAEEGKASWAERIESNKVESVFGLSESSDKIQQDDLDTVVKGMRRDFTEKEEALEQREQKLLGEIDKVQQSYNQQQAQMFELQKQISLMLRGQGMPRASNPNGQPQLPNNTQQARLEGETVAQRSDPYQPNIVYRAPTQIVTPETINFDNDVIRTITQRKITQVRENGIMEVTDNQMSTISANNMKTKGEVKSKSKSDNNPRVNDKDNGEFTLSMGSLISGTLINGAAAPTGVSSSSQPVPVLMRIKREAIMPNSFTLDIRECHMIGEAVGSLSDERAQIRAVGISCITEDGQAIEKSIMAYAVSSTDGMAGVRGEVVSRSGSMIANTMTAGFFSGFAEAASPKQVGSLNTTPQADTLWQTQNLNQFAGAGILKGASTSLDRLSDYYMSMVEQMFPVIELLPGTEIDFIVQKGMTLNLNPEIKQEITQAKHNQSAGGQ
ncbi:MAG: conjugal transfer pilus assembly protein TraB [Oleiphilaceae bacterium]|jgi:conjugal transfer pilus assembly protein TraB